MPESESELPQIWSPAARVGFRFLLAYFVLYVAVPGVVWDAVLPEVARAVFGVELLYRPNGSGDTTYNYVELFVRTGLALLGCGIWTVAERERQAYPKLAAGLIVAVRYFLAVMLVSYGFAKLFLTQFSQPGLAQLLQPLGMKSPMGLAWTFIGYSHAYQFMAGALELVAGLLLFSRRTTTLGALLSAGVMGNVVMMNFCFDIPVKLFSSHLLAMAMGLAALDGRRLLAVLVTHEAAEPKQYPRHFERRWLHIGGRVVKALVIGALLVSHVYYGKQNAAQYGPGAERSPLRGIYEVREMVEEGEAREPLVTDASRWRYLVFDGPGFITVQRMDGSLEHYGAALDLGAGTLTVTERGDRFSFAYLTPQPTVEPNAYVWTIVELDDSGLRLRGPFAELEQLELRLEPREIEFLLSSRGYNWINEVPLNR